MMQTSLNSAETVPAVQNFEKNGNEIYKLNTAKQVFSTDEFSKAKTQYLADSMVKKGLIKDYTIKTVTDASQGEGIVLVKQPITFELPAAVTTSKIDAYQIDINQDKTVIHSDYIQGIQNGAMTICRPSLKEKAFLLVLFKITVIKLFVGFRSTLEEDTIQFNG